MNDNGKPRAALQAAAEGNKRNIRRRQNKRGLARNGEVYLRVFHALGEAHKLTKREGKALILRAGDRITIENSRRPAGAPKIRSPFTPGLGGSAFVIAAMNVLGFRTAAEARAFFAGQRAKSQAELRAADGGAHD